MYVNNMKRKVKYIVLHCTATNPDATVESIKRYWKENLGWKNVGYHILIDKNGLPNYLADFNSITNGVKGYNHESIHISYIGGIDEKGKPKDTRTMPQKATILDCIREVLEWYGEKLIIQGHRDFPNVNKACPSFDCSEYSWITA